MENKRNSTKFDSIGLLKSVQAKTKFIYSVVKECFARMFLLIRLIVNTKNRMYIHLGPKFRWKETNS